MHKKTKNITLVTSCALILLGIVVSPQVTKADDISVSGNGQDSNNSVSVTSNQQTTPQQTNISQITNTTTTSASTGNNTASSNAGNTSVSTGDANVSTTVNTAANTSSINQNCCSTQGSSVEITGNGENSTNSVNVTSSNTTAVTVNQNATIANNVSQYADAGYNTANGNNGNVSIKTGDSIAQVYIKNGPINVSNINVSANSKSTFFSKIADNAEGSVSNITNRENNATVISINNAANIINNLKTTYITGENNAVSNTGNVVITTGSIASIVTILNGPINENSVSVTCNQSNKSTKPPTSTPSSNVPASSSNSSSSGSGGGSGSSSSGGPGSVLGASVNNLPVTGSYWFFIALIGNILMMLLGGYLRLRSGRSPGYAFAI